ncbi:hypothetical protein CK203_009828 [Vitis vinifera]|uniref:Uncharacterized protein n=1 Tax=Vitis vinifera TaxID=29760 RepID=A0A438JV42_VITVI|nr:hypothetical protein CK203_009828 [Vitis vinifera]
MLQPELVRRVERDLLNIMAGGTAENVDILVLLTSLFEILLASKELNIGSSHVEVAEQEEDGDEHARNASKKSAPAPIPKPDVPEAGANAGEPDRSESDESDDSM